MVELNFEQIDLGSFGINEELVEQPLRSTLSEAIKVNPDEAVKIKKLSSQSGIPSFAVENDKQPVEDQLKFEQIDFDTLTKDSPKTTDYLTFFDNASISHDDIDVLANIEDVLDFGKTFEGIGGTIKESFKSQILGLTAAGIEMSKSDTEDVLSRFGINVDLDDDTVMEQAKKEATEGILTRLRESKKVMDKLRPEDLNILEQGVRGGVESLANMAPGFGLMLLSGGRSAPLLATIGTQSFGASYAEGIAEGFTPEKASWFGMIDAAIEVGTELIPLKTLENFITGEVKGLGKQALKFAIQEMGTEQLATLGQSLNQYIFGLDKEIENAETVEDIVAIQMQRQAVTAIATVVAGGAQIGIATGIRKTMDALQSDEQKKQQEYVAGQQTIDRLNSQAEQSKLKARDKESFKQFVEKADGDNNTTVFIDASQTALYLQEKSQDEIDADPALQILDEQVREAAAVGGEVQVPVADFAVEIAGTEHFDALRDSMTMSEETVSPFRQEQAQVETQNYVQRMLDTAQENVSEYAEAQEIYQTVRQQLIDSGRVTPQNASVMANLVPAWATAKAQRENKSVQQVYEESGLKIEGPLTGEKARLEGELDVLTQGMEYDQTGQIVTESENFKNWFGDSKVVDDQGEPLVVYHGTSADFTEFKPTKSLREGIFGAEYEVETPAFFFTANRDTAQVFAKNREEFKGGDAKILDVYIDLKNPIDLTGKLPDRYESREDGVFDSETGNYISTGSNGDVVAERANSRELFQTLTELTGVDLIQEGVAEEMSDHPVQKQYQFNTEELLLLLDDKDVVDRLKEAGYDGAVLDEGVEDGQTLGKSYAVFNPTQIKSVNNRGTFDPVDPNILRQNVDTTTENIGTFDPADPNIFKQPTSPGQPGARGYYDPENSLIRMTETSNLSTFLHEYGHFMYDMEGKGGTDMYQSINNWYKRDAATVATEANKFLNKKEYDAEKQDSAGTRGKVSEPDVIAYIDQGTTESPSKDAAVNRAIHEQFARGFETYLMEGVAPSIELRNAFATIARWLTQIYRAIRGDLKVKLDAEMRQLYDRLLATEEQIAAAEARSRFEPMFTSAAMAGMTEEEFEAYKKRQEKIKDKQTETLRDELIKQLTRQTEKWWKEEKTDLINEEIESLKTEKVYTAADQLRNGDIKLDFATVKDIVGEQKTDKIGRKSIRVSPKLRGMTAKEHKGVHPDQAAAMFGYNSGAEMLNDIVNAPSIKEVADTRAEAIMIERHGDILTDGTIERAADDAVKNEERGRLILQELKVLSRNTSVPTIDRKTIKALTKEKIGELSFREIFPGKYRKAEIKAAQESTAALKEGNKEAAASAKMRQVMNYYLGMEAAEAKAGTMKIVDRMSRYNKKKVREEIIKADGGYWDQLEKILNRFEFRKSATLKSVENINTWMKEQIENEGAGLMLSNAVLDESYITHWKNVPYADLQGINDSVKNIEHVARYSNKIDLLQEKVDFLKVVNDWVDNMNEKVESKFTPTASVADDPAKWQKWGRWAMAQMTKIPFMASWLDGGERVGMSHQLLVQRFTDAYDAEVRLWDEAAKPVMDMILNRSKEDIKRHNTKYYIPEIAGTAFHTGNMMGHEIIAVALNTGNESNLRKLLLGEGWANPDDDTTISFQNPKLQAVLSKMTVSDWQLVQTIWDQMETLYPALAEVHRKTTGLTPPKIEKTPIEVQGMTLNGGYYPMKYDPSRNNRVQEQEDKLNAQTESMFSNTASIQASVNIGATNERTKYYAPVRLSLDVVQNHFQETIHYITHHDAVRQVNKLIRNNEVTNTIKAKLGPDEYAQLRPWLNDIAKDGREAPVKMFWDDILQRLRFGITLGVMGFKASTGIIQIAGLSNAFAEMGTASTLQALRSVVGSPRTMRDSWDFAKENSKVMNHRVNTMDREIKNAMRKLEDKKGFKAAVQEASMKHIALIQTYMVDLPTWHAGYIAEMKRSGDEQKAYQYADWAIENIQGSGITKDMAAIMRGQSETGRMLTMFMTYFSSLWNLERDLVRGVKARKYSTTTIAAKTAFLFIVPVLFEMAMRGEFGGEDKEPEEKLQKMLTNVALYPVQSVPFVRDIASATVGEYGYNISPVASLIEQTTQAAPGLLEGILTDEEVTKAQAKSVSKAVGAVIGLPGTGQAWATGEHLYQVLEEGEDLAFRQLLFGPRRD